MGRREEVVFALPPPGEPVEPFVLAQCVDAVPPAGDELMGVNLVPHVEEDAVSRGVKHVMKSESELDRAEVCAQMTSGHGRNHPDDLFPGLLGEGLQFGDGKLLQVFRTINAVQQFAHALVRPSKSRWLSWDPRLWLKR